MKRRAFFFGLLAVVFLGFAAVVGAQDAAERIRERLPALDDLKQEGKVGEDNAGFVAERGAVSSAERQLIQAENADRRELYQVVARRSGQTVEEVGQQRAVRIAQIASSGVWLQDTRGRWYRKP